MKEKIGIIAGEGSLPRILSQQAMEMGHQTYAIGMNLKSFLDLQGVFTEGAFIPGAQGMKCVSYLKSKGVEHIIFIGKIHKLWAISQIPFLDELGKSCLRRMVDLQDNTFHEVLTQITHEQGFKILPQITFLRHLLAEKANYTERPLTEEEQRDVDFGFDMAKRASALDVSQMVVVKNKSVMAFEAAEGTDKTIERGCKLARRGGVVVKVAWKKQSDKFDLPTIGPRTIQTISKNKGSVLAIEAGSTFIAEKEKTIQLAKKLGVALIAI
jgi:DUF1009 family protein